MALGNGMRLGRYEIVAPLGAGGMGEVYRARDLRLKRDVAIKLLPAGLAEDPARRARFAREAELLASLNHPNIAAIYGVEDAANVTALVLELVEGPTLDERVARGAVPVQEALTIALQIAAAMEAAHDRGVIHRDLKPANVKLTADGQVKVLDFGLAKALDSGTPPASVIASPTVTDPGTRAGAVLGTPAYMSPEQARGHVVDERTDIWAFGCVLVELLTGRPAFGGDTVADVLAAVVGREPDWAALPHDTPPEVQRLLRRCLQKDPKRRLRHIGDARLELEESTSPLPLTAPAPHVRGRVHPAIWLALATAGGVVAGVAVNFSRSAFDPDALADVTVERLTFDAGLTTMPAISTDGRLIAYASDRAGGGDLDIWVQLSEGAPLRVTTDRADEVTPHFSPDGSQLVFRSEAAGGGVFVIPTLGGTPRLIAADGRAPRFSPDGSRIAYWTGGFRGGSLASSATYVTTLDGGEPLRVLADFETARDPVWAPDGQSLLVSAVARRSSGVDDLDWWWVPLDGRAPVRTGAARLAPVRAGLAATAGATWTEEGLVFSDDRDLWLLPVSMSEGGASSTARRLTVAAQQYTYPSVSRDGRIVFASAVTHRVIGRAALSATADAPPTVTIFEDTRDEGGRASQTADGSQIVFERGLPAGREIWMKTVATGDEHLVARVSEREILNATVSPDGSRVAFTAAGSGFIVETAGGVPRPICEECTLWGFLSNSRQLLVTGPQPGGGNVINLTDVNSGATRALVHVTSGNLNRPHASPDDRWIAFRHESPDGGKTFVAALDAARPATLESARMVDEPTVTGRPAGWSMDSSILYLLLDTDGWRCLWSQRIDRSGQLVGVPTPARHFHAFTESRFGTSFGNAISAAGMLFNSRPQTANLWILQRQPAQ